jgi:hypothetical protein
MGQGRNAPPALQPVVVDKVGSPEQLRERVRSLRAAAMRRLGVRLVELGLVTPEQLREALGMQSADSSLRLGHALVDLGFVSEAHLAQVVCEQLGIPLVDLETFPIDRALLPLLPAQWARRYRMLPLCRMDARLYVAMADPLDAEALEQARFCARMPVTPAIALRGDLEEAIGNLYDYGAMSYGRSRNAPSRPAPALSRRRPPGAEQERAVYAVRRSRRTRAGTPRRASRPLDGSPRARGSRNIAAAGSPRAPC